MQCALFRSLEDWKTTLLTLPDNAYLELLRGAFGTIKTPFNKQRLMDDLIAFLSREEIKKRIALYLDETDQKILTAVALLGKPTAQDLERFFAGEFSYLELHGFLINLEERFILYRFQEEESRCLTLNPLLEKVLTPHIRHERLLFPWVPAEPPGEPITNASESSGKLPLDDRVLAGLIAFVLEERSFFKAEGGIRKKVLEQGNRLFPGLNLLLHIRALQGLGLFRENRGKDGTVEGLSPDPSKLRAFQRLSPQERLEYWAGGIYLNEANPSGTHHREPLRSVAEFIHSLLRFLEPGRRYPRITLERFAKLLQARGKSYPQADFGSLLIALELTGLLESSDLDFWSRGATNMGEPNKPVLVMDTAFSCVIYPEITFADALSLAFFSNFRGIGITARFELTRQSVVRGFDRGMDVTAMLSLLNRLSGNRIDPNLDWTLKDWEQRYAEVTLQQGVVLTLSENRRYLAEAGPLARLVTRTLAPGVYLLSVSEQSQAAEALEKAGIEILAQRNLSGNREGSGGGSYQLFDVQPWIPAESSGTYQSDQEQVEALKEQFRGLLRTMSLSPAEQDALTDRIERRLILSESQLSGASLRSEKLEARGLDYVGKAVIAKQAIATQSLVEVSLPHSEGGTRKVVGIPEALEKWGGESVLILKPLAQNRSPLEGVQAEPEALRLPLGKIGLLRRIKPSFFGA